MSIQNPTSAVRRKYTWQPTPATDLPLKRKSKQMLAYLQLLKYCSDWASRKVLLKMILARTNPAFARRADPGEPNQTQNIRLNQMVVTFSVLEQLLTYLEIFVDQCYMDCPGFALQPDWVVIDGGANIGFFTLQAAQICQAVHAFEPDPRAYQHLSQNVQRNAPTRVRLIAKALGKVAAKGYVESSRLTTTDSVVHKLEPTQLSLSQANFPVNITTLDAYAAETELTHVDLLKLDIEGFEAEALMGAQKLLPNVRRIVIEYHNYIVADVLSTVSTLLAAAGFRQVRQFDYTLDSIGIVFFENTKVS